MISLEGLGTPIEKLPLELEHVRDLEEFDGPLLSEFRAPNGETFLYSWCDRDDHANRWIIARTPLQILCRYLVGGISLRQVIVECRDGFVYIVELDSEAEVTKAWLITTNDLPASYVPGERSFHQRDANTECGFQDVFVGDKWGQEELLSYPSKYLDAYAVHSALGRGSEPVGHPGVWLDYNLTQGWIFHTAYQTLRAMSAENKQGSLAAMGVASPGFYRFKVDPTVAEGLRRAVVAYRANRKDIERVCAEMSAWANKRLDLHDKAVLERIDWVCGVLGIDGHALRSRIATTHAAAKMVASYVDRVTILAQRDASGNAMLVGLPSPIAVRGNLRRK